MLLTCSLLLVVAAPDELSITELNILSPERNPFSRRSLLVGSPEIQQSLNLSAEQIAKVEAIKKKALADLSAGRVRLRGEAKIENGVFHLVFDENDRAVGEVLDADQLKKLGQHQLQRINTRSVFHFGLLSRYLEITEAQQEEWRKMVREEILARQKAEAGKEGPARMNAMMEHARTHRLDPMTLLTAEQQKMYRDLLGERQKIFAFTPEFRDPAAFVPRREMSPYQSVLGDFMSPFRLLFCDGLLKELNVTEQQRKQLVDLVNRNRREVANLTKANRKRIENDEGGLRREFMESRSQRVEQCWKDLRGILSEVQIKRLNEAWLQSRGYDELFSGTETAKQLGVTTAQRNALTASYKSRNIAAPTIKEKMSGILTAEQKAAFERLKGPPLDRSLIDDLRATANAAIWDEFGVPRFGIGSEGP